MSIRGVVTRGYGPGAAIKFVVTRGYIGGAAPAVVTTQPDRSDGKPRRRRARNADDELTEAEVQWMQRKLLELKAAKTERERVAAAKSLEVSLAQATQDDEAADIISASIQEKGVSTADAMRDVALLTSITNQLEQIVKAAAIERRRLEDEDDVESLLMML